eukprot:GHVS01013568.1.p1 GENE.GHVS01013568.1~~GHVS01013568.1.p1  ORF type:complete len:392 (+),score=68.88 GHVS01013568.1:71-1177(+)
MMRPFPLVVRFSLFPPSPSVHPFRCPSRQAESSLRVLLSCPSSSCSFSTNSSIPSSVLMASPSWPVLSPPPHSSSSSSSSARLLLPCCMPQPMFRLAHIRHFSGAPKPTWHLPPDQVFHPQIPDKHHYMEHPALSGPLLWWRACRPYVEKIASDVYKSLHRIVVEGIWQPTREWWVRHNPEFRLQMVALVSFFIVQYCITSYFTNHFQTLVDLRNTLHLLHAKDLEEKHFFDSESEAMERKSHEYAQDHRRLTDLWKDALHEATVHRSFDVLCDRLKLTPQEEHDIKPYRSEANSFRFEMIPYGKENEHTQTFPVPAREQPLRSFSLNFTYSNLSGDWGDYVDRKDNKAAPLRHARPMFTDVYIPGTK